MPRMPTRPPATSPWRARELGLHGLERRADRQVGEVGKGLAGARRVDRAGQQPHADQEFLLGGEDAQPVEHLLVERPSSPRNAVSRVGEIGAVGQFGSSAGSSRPSKTCGRRVMMPASRGAAPMMVAISFSSAGLYCSSENSWMPAGRPARNASKRSSASSARRSRRRPPAAPASVRSAARALRPTASRGSGRNARCG